LNLLQSRFACKCWKKFENVDEKFVNLAIAMSEQYCFLCASDEGVFLDVTPDNLSAFGDQLEICLTTKVDIVDKYFRIFRKRVLQT